MTGEGVIVSSQGEDMRHALPGVDSSQLDNRLEVECWVKLLLRIKLLYEVFLVWALFQKLLLQHSRGPEGFLELGIVFLH